MRASVEKANGTRGHVLLVWEGFRGDPPHVGWVVQRKSSLEKKERKKRGSFANVIHQASLAHLLASTHPASGRLCEGLRCRSSCLLSFGTFWLAARIGSSSSTPTGLPGCGRCRSPLPRPGVHRETRVQNSPVTRERLFAARIAGDEAAPAEEKEP